MRSLLASVLLLVTFSSRALAQDHDAHHDHVMSMPDPAAGSATPPPVPDDHAADRFYDSADMARAREALRHESGGMGASMLMVDRLEWRSHGGRQGYAWEVEGWTGGDLDRLAFKTRGERGANGDLDKAEAQVGWSHALDPWFNLRAGVRQDIRPRPMRTHAVLAVEGIAPYWFELEGEVFLSNKGELTGRAEANYDLRLSQRVILQPAVELNFSAQNVELLRLGSGVSSVELGARVRYEFAREFAPYLGIHWERKIGSTARFARAYGEDVGGLSVVAGVRLWF